jgi:hypothetical protein
MNLRQSKETHAKMRQNNDSDRKDSEEGRCEAGKKMESGEKRHTVWDLSRVSDSKW